MARSVRGTTSRCASQEARGTTSRCDSQEARGTTSRCASLQWRGEQEALVLTKEFQKSKDCFGKHRSRWSGLQAEPRASPFCRRHAGFDFDKNQSQHMAFWGSKPAHGFSGIKASTWPFGDQSQHMAFWGSNIHAASAGLRK